MQCYGSPYDAKYHSESGASRAILEAGKNIDSLMLRYGRVDWANKANWQCNGGCVGVCYWECVLNTDNAMHGDVLTIAQRGRPYRVHHRNHPCTSSQGAPLG